MSPVAVHSNSISGCVPAEKDSVSLSKYLCQKPLKTEKPHVTKLPVYTPKELFPDSVHIESSLLKT